MMLMNYVKSLRNMRVIVRADMPGCGKSYACEKMKARGHNVLFVCPTNKLVQNYKSGGVTMNKSLLHEC